MVRLTSVPGQACQLIQALRSVKRGVDRGGSLHALVASDVDDANVVWFVEEWPSVETFEQHLRSEQFARVLSIIEVAAEAPLLECRLVSETRGLDYVAAVRGVAPADRRR